MANRLATEKSPYLLQHAHNPVDWFPWGSEAFERAEQLNRPIFLSIGYATCHWGHVMERESFENGDVAALLNAHFVPIKVDREERPDVDQIYMRALHATGQHGGWPLNMFLAPDRRPITGGTYFPPQPAYGRPSFAQVLQSVAQAWERDRARLLEAATSLTAFLETGERATGGLPTPEQLLNATQGYERTFDAYRGGFLNNGPNKFPPSMGLLFLLRQYERSARPELLSIVETTLDHMKRGGIYDQVGGGLARYSTDHDWLVPHFEKMLYDNALFAMGLTEAYRLTQNDRYRTWALDVFEYVARDMTSTDGAFFSAEDADSEGEEGRFYVWTEAQFREALKEQVSREELGLLLKFWSVTARGNFEGANILHESLPRDEFCRAVGRTASDVEELAGRARAVLLTARSSRARPLRDDKVLTSWNALLISALCRASQAFDMPELARRAQRAAEFIWTVMRRTDGTLLRRFREGDARHLGTLADYALFGGALVDLYRSTFEPVHMERAAELATEIERRFATGDGAYYDADSEARDLIVRSVDAYDGVEPSGNSAAARLFLALSGYGIDAARNHERCAGVLRKFGRTALESPTAHPALLTVADSLASPGPEIIVVAAKGTEEASIGSLRQLLGPDGILAVASGPGAGIEQAVPLMEGRTAQFPERTFYVCRNQTCERPVGTLEEAAALVRDGRGST